jgi:biotin synthase-related radical SAM superfamily protein
VLQREISSAVAIYCLGALKADFISSLIDSIVIDITQLRCPKLIDINLLTLSCSLPYHNRLKYDCAQRSAYSISQWLNFKMLAEQCVKCPSQPEYH